MLSKKDRETTLKPVFSPMGKWLKKLFQINAAKKEKPVVDTRVFLRLSHDEIHPLDLCLMQHEQVFVQLLKI